MLDQITKCQISYWIGFGSCGNAVGEFSVAHFWRCFCRYPGDEHPGRYFFELGQFFYYFKLEQKHQTFRMHSMIEWSFTNAGIGMLAYCSLALSVESYLTINQVKICSLENTEKF